MRKGTYTNDDIMNIGTKVLSNFKEWLLYWECAILNNPEEERIICELHEYYQIIVEIAMVEVPYDIVVLDGLQNLDFHGRIFFDSLLLGGDKSIIGYAAPGT